MASPRLLALLFFAAVIPVYCQEPPLPQLSPGSARKPPTASSPVPQTIPLTVPKGTPLQIALDGELQVKKVGQRVHARTVEPVYAFDRIVVPVGTEVVGEITRIDGISGGKRTLAALNADFTPLRKVELGFNELVLPDGRHLPIQTSVTPGSGQVIQFITAADADKKKNVKDLASEKTRQAKQQARTDWDNAMKQLKTPGRIHRLARYGESQLPVHRQYISAGTVYFAELEEPLDFGTEIMTPRMARSMGGPLSEGSVVHALLVTPLSSSTSHKGELVEAVLSRPLFAGDTVILPQGTRLKGTVRQAAPARHLKRNGQLRIAFSELVPPDGMEQKVAATLEGVQAGKDANVKLDAEGGAEATTSKSRYLATGVSIGLAAISARADEDAGPAGDTSRRAAGGAGGFKLVGAVMGAAVRSRAFGYTMGGYGAAMSVYSHFIARGREVVFPKNTAMQIGVGARAEGQSPGKQPGAAGN